MASEVEFSHKTASDAGYPRFWYLNVLVSSLPYLYLIKIYIPPLSVYFSTLTNA